MKKIEPFNKVWLNCLSNLKMSLLIDMNEEYEVLAYNNKYSYSSGEYSTDGGSLFSYFSMDQRFLKMNDFCEEIKWNPKNKQVCIQRIIEHISKKDSYVLLLVDLYDWLEGSVCWHKFHWDHYTLIIDYNTENEEFTAFDELRGKYIKFKVDKDKIYPSLFESNSLDKVIFITLDRKFVPHIDTIEDFIDNAKQIVTSIDKLQDLYYWKMTDDDYNAKSYLDLLCIYMDRIQGQNNANSLIFKKNRTIINTFGNLKCESFYNDFLKIVSQWQRINMRLVRIYFDIKNRGEMLDELNAAVKNTLLQEKKIWSDFMA